MDQAARPSIIFHLSSLIRHHMRALKQVGGCFVKVNRKKRKDKETVRHGDKETKRTRYLTSSPCLPLSLSPCLFLTFCPFQKHRELLEKIVFFGTQRALEETRQVAQHAGLAAPVRKLHEPDQIEHQRRREQRIAPLPNKLQRH